jgi:ABC-2 type transport system ATP-binding protein
MAAALAVELQDLTKRFRHTVALDRLSLQVPEGSVFGFLGPNGAGKTTALRILTGLAFPTAGTARVFDHDVGTLDSRARAEIGFLPDVPGFYPWMTAAEFLRFSGRLFGIADSVLGDRIGSLLEMAGLARVRTRVGGFSRGMKQRLGVAQALINAPRLLLLDEPTSALDPIGRREVLEMIASLRGRTTVFFSTHILGDVERVCDAVAILDRGRLAASATIAELKRRVSAQKVTIEVDGEATSLAARLSGAPWLRQLVRDGAQLDLTVSDLAAACRAIPEAIAAAGMGLRRLETGEASLEDVFVEVIGEPRR